MTPYPADDSSIHCRARRSAASARPVPRAALAVPGRDGRLRRVERGAHRIVRDAVAAGPMRPRREDRRLHAARAASTAGPPELPCRTSPPSAGDRAQHEVRPYASCVSTPRCGRCAPGDRGERARSPDSRRSPRTRSRAARRAGAAAPSGRRTRSTATSFFGSNANDLRAQPALAGRLDLRVVLPGDDVRARSRPRRAARPSRCPRSASPQAVPVTRTTLAYARRTPGSRSTAGSGGSIGADGPGDRRERVDARPARAAPATASAIEFSRAEHRRALGGPAQRRPLGLLERDGADDPDDRERRERPDDQPAGRVERPQRRAGAAPSAASRRPSRPSTSSSTREHRRARERGERRVRRGRPAVQEVRREPRAEHRADRDPGQRQRARDQPAALAERTPRATTKTIAIQSIRVTARLGYGPWTGDELQAFIDRYNAAWGDHDVDAIVAMHTDDSVFENHVTGDVNVGQGRDRARDQRHLHGLPRSLVRDAPPVHPREPRRPGVDGAGHAPRQDDPLRDRGRADRPQGRLPRDGRDPDPRRPRRAQGRLLRLDHAAPPARADRHRPDRCGDDPHPARHRRAEPGRASHPRRARRRRAGHAVDRGAGRRRRGRGRRRRSSRTCAAAASSRPTRRTRHGSCARSAADIRKTDEALATAEHLRAQLRDAGPRRQADACAARWRTPRRSSGSPTGSPSTRSGSGRSSSCRRSRRRSRSPQTATAWIALLRHGAEAARHARQLGRGARDARAAGAGLVTRRATDVAARALRAAGARCCARRRRPRRLHLRGSARGGSSRSSSALLAAAGIGVGGRSRCRGATRRARLADAVVPVTVDAAGPDVRHRGDARPSPPRRCSRR